MRLLVLSHGHPTFSKGGGELAAYALYKEIDSMDGYAAWFAARAPSSMVHPGTSVSAINDREYLVLGEASYGNLASTIDLDDASDFAQMLRNINPEVIHFHHYFLLGIDLLHVAKRVCPNAKIVLTLHEYIAICQNMGQMVKTNGKLCYRSSPRECYLCMPRITPESHFLREREIKAFFSNVDMYVSPSEFLKERYVQWGVDANKIAVIENGLTQGVKVPPRKLHDGEVRGRFAYFGQINPFKGLDVILEAIGLLPKKIRKQITLDVFGTGLEYQSQEYQQKIKEILARYPSIIRYHGPYEQDELSMLMSDIDWVVMGSIWWENSPLVIQEAYKYGRPVICPNIGGMAEKVLPGVGGVHYRVGDSVSLSSVMGGLVRHPQTFDSLLGTLPDYPDIHHQSLRHIELYRKL